MKGIDNVFVPVYLNVPASHIDAVVPETVPGTGDEMNLALNAALLLISFLLLVKFLRRAGDDA